MLEMLSIEEKKRAPGRGECAIALKRASRVIPFCTFEKEHEVRSLTDDVFRV